jgi:hypothetical protein
MKVTFCCDNGANIHSKRKEKFDTEKDLGFTDEEWNEMTDEEKYEIVKDWAFEKFDYWLVEE